MSFTVADLIAQTLADVGVRRIWGITGDSLNGLNDSLRRLGSITWMHVRHEETAAFAAGAEASLSGRLAVCAGSCGPGNLHLINGLFDCQRNHVPVLAIAAQIPSSEIGLGYFQETHPQELFRECAEFVELVSNPAQMPALLHRAINTALGRNGVAVLVIPGDVALAPAPVARVPPPALPAPPRLLPTTGELERLAERLNASKAITLLAGSGCAGQHDAVVALAGRLKAPVVHALRGKEHVEWDNPYDVGMTGLIGFASGYHAMANADTLLMLGTDFPYRAFYPQQAAIVQIDRDPSALGRRAPLAQGLVGEIGETLQALLPLLSEHSDRNFLDTALQHYVKARAGLDDLAVPTPADTPLHPQYVAQRISALAAEDAVFTADVGTPTVWAARHLKMNGRRRLLGSFNHGSMANALLQAIGAQATEPARQVVSLSGDGGFSMMLGDFISLSQLALPVKVVVFNNGSLGFVAMEMKAGGYLDTGTDLHNPDFAAMAAAMGVASFRVTDAAKLDEALNAAFAHPGPALVEVLTAKQELVLPPKVKLEQAKGFSLYLLKAIINGRGDEVIDLARTNLR